MGARKRFRVLVVDDEEAMRTVLEMRLQDWGFAVRTAQDAAEARALVESFAPDLVLTDLVLPETSGMELLAILREGDPARPVILMTAYGSIDAAVEAMKLGADDFLTKPLDYDKLRASLAGAQDEIDQRRDVARLEARLEGNAGFGLLVGRSKVMRQVYELVDALASTDAPAIITGESGTGKELVARTVHDRSARAQGPFVAVNAAAIPEGLTEGEMFGYEKGAFTGATATRAGLFELADGGTLFLDELGEMAASLQPKFLRVLEEGKVRRLGATRETAFDVRVLAATNRDPERAVAEGVLRTDLFYRLNVFTIELPPLRKRRSDLPLLIQHFLRGLNDKHRTTVEGVRPEALALLRAYAWPGNVRELSNVIERAVVLARDGSIEPSHLPPFIRERRHRGPREVVLPPDVTAREAETILIRETLQRVGGNKAEAARRLGLDVKTVRSKLQESASEEGEDG